MYYVTRRGSETGIKFDEVSKNMEIARKQAKGFAEKYKFKQWRGRCWRVSGGISSCVGFEEAPDKKSWGKGAKKGEFMPKKNSKIGKAISKEIDELKTVTIDELNQCVGFDGAPFKTIGFSENNDKYFGFVLDEKWGFIPPKDCEEVTTTKYRELFN